MEAMIFGSASSPCSAQYVKNLNAKTFEKTDPRAFKAIVECHYVDDYVDSFETVDEAVTVAANVISIHARAGFELRGFVSNSSKFLRLMNQKESIDNNLNLTSLGEGETATEKILGLSWSFTDDTFCFVLKFSKVPKEVLNGCRKPTKSEVLSLTMSIFDPFGFLANMDIISKILLQELWRYNIDWNSPIPEEVYGKWFKWYRVLERVRYIKIPRYYGSPGHGRTDNIDLHIFVAASEVAFAAVGFWRISHEGQVSIAFVAGKSKCAPIKHLTIPRLELLAAVLGVRLMDTILSSHDLKPRKTVLWSDSKTVIKWMRSNNRVYKQFVANRIAEILEISDAEQWRWVPGEQNPADNATRPQFSSQPNSDSCWLKGPQFLQYNFAEWPKLPDNVDTHEVNSEIRSKYLMTITDDNPLIAYDGKSCWECN